MIAVGETLTRKIGPLPVWAYGVAIGGAYVAYTFLQGGNARTGSGDDPEDVEDVELSPVVVGGGSGGTTGGYQDTSGENGIQGPEGPKGDPGPAGAKGATGAKGSTGRPGCPAGYKPVKASTGKWRCQAVKRPRVKKGYRLQWDPNGFRWKVVKKKTSLHLDDLHQVPHSGYEFAPNGAVPTISDKDVPAIAIAPLDHSPVPARPVPLYRPGTWDPPVIPRVPPSRNSRPYGRPFHGVSHER